MNVIISEPSELVVMLSSVGLYKTALHLCDEFKINKCSVFENLASQCIKLSLNEDPDAWEWLLQNDIFGKFGSFVPSKQNNLFNFNALKNLCLILVH